ncbi:glycosyltransferase [Psychrobacter sp. ASPA161_9]|uniref:glycosyltransferase n=1 Tax=Psychrobacter sp. ASPA161_9 TaxID=3160961 RepID=UPI003F801B5C
MLPLSPEVIKYNSIAKNKLPMKVLNTIHKMNDINPRVYPPFNGCGMTFDYYDKVTDSLYSTLALAAGDKNYNGVVLIPRIRTGGTDKLLKSYLRALCEGIGLEILIICEDSTTSTWTEEFEELADILYLDEIYNSKTPPTYKIASINYYINLLEPEFIWAFNSRLAYFLIGTYGAALSKITDIWVVTFAHWIHEVSYREFGMIHDYILHCEAHIKYIVSDNSNFIEKLERQYQLNRGKLIYIPSPNSLKDIIYKPNIKRKKIKVLWASGIEWNKGIDTLSEIANILNKQNIEVEIDVYGTPKNNKGYKLLDKFKEQISKVSNINYKSTFSSFDALLPNDYDVFLFTSIIEGMPNILLEAAENQMFIITSNVGGISDLIKDGRTGYLIENSLDPYEYVERIRDFINLDNNQYNDIRKTLVSHYNSVYTSKCAIAEFKNILNKPDSGTM